MTLPVGRRSIARACVTLLFLLGWTPLASAADLLHPAPFTSTISSVPSGETSAFTNVTLAGRDEAEFTGKWIRIVTTVVRAGLVSRIKAFNPATGELTLHDAIPAGAVTAGDSYLVGDTPIVVGASGDSRFLMASSQPGCVPEGTNGPDVIICTGADSVGVASGEATDVVVVTGGASVATSETAVVTAVGIDKSPTSIDTGAGDDTVLNGGEVR